MERVSPNPERGVVMDLRKEAYQNYQQLALEKKVAWEELYSSQTVNDMQMDWGMWGPWGYDGPMQ
jgi:hypothetical protein